jgi:hypothetical protein
MQCRAVRDTGWRHGLRVASRQVVALPVVPLQECRHKMERVHFMNSNVHNKLELLPVVINTSL